MKYLSVKEIAALWNTSERSVRNYCAAGRVPGAFLTGKTWTIPENAEKPERSNKSKPALQTLADILKEEKRSRTHGGIYHKVQVELTYNSNHMEGSRLTHEQTRFIFETNTVGITEEGVRVDDIIETANHFRCIDEVIECAKSQLSEKFIKHLHFILKTGTSDARKDWFAVGEYKKLPNEVGGRETTLPEEVSAEMKRLLDEYNGKKTMKLEDILGLGKTIEAGLVLKYVLESGAKRVLIALPASLRKQWELELEDKFGLESVILDRLTVEKDGSDWRKRLTDNKSVRIVLTSYDYSSKLMKRFPEVKWDFIIIDEAHNLRNVFHGTKRAKNLYELSKGIPKILLTATPLQNSLTDLHGLVSFIDQRIFGSEKVFNKRYIEGQDYSDLKRELSPVLYRTLRKDVAKYMNFKKRTCKTVDFTLSQDEIELYQRVNDFLKRELLYSIPTSNRGLIILVIRKLLASSSFALIETFEILKNRLEKLYEGSKSANAQEGFDLFWSYVEDEIDESGFEETEDEDTIVQKQFI